MKVFEESEIRNLFYILMFCLVVFCGTAYAQSNAEKFARPTFGDVFQTLNDESENYNNKGV